MAAKPHKTGTRQKWTKAILHYLYQVTKQRQRFRIISLQKTALAGRKQKDEIRKAAFYGAAKNALNARRVA